MSLISIPQEWLYPSNLIAAAQIQRQLAEKVITEDQLPIIHTIGGMDISNNPYDPKKIIYAGVIHLQANSLTLINSAHAAIPALFPYIPGYLSFREAPALILAIKELPIFPDILFIDGQGISHPRGLGIASHIGILLNIPTIGVAKSILIGKPEGELNENEGSHIPLKWKGKKIGTVLRTKKKCNPLIISPGHKISHETAVDFVMNYCRGYRLPEPTRLAHLASNIYRKQKTHYDKQNSV